MTRLQLYRKVKSLVWRRRLAESLDGLEAEIIGYMLAIPSNQIVVAGYLVKLIRGKLVLEKRLLINSNQLKFDFVKKTGGEQWK